MKLSIAIVILFYMSLFILIEMADAATLNITIKDSQTGKPINGVSVTITPKIGNAAQGNSDVRGYLRIQDLTAGNYTITTSSIKYVEKVMENILLALDETKSIEIILSPRTSEIFELEKVSVTASRRKEKVLEAMPRLRLLIIHRYKTVLP